MSQDASLFDMVCSVAVVEQSAHTCSAVNKGKRKWHGAVDTDDSLALVPERGKHK